MGIQYDAKDLATLVTSLMKVLSQKLDECSVYFQVGSLLVMFWYPQSQLVNTVWLHKDLICSTLVRM